jgi:hypothetical protein
MFESYRKRGPIMRFFSRWLLAGNPAFEHLYEQVTYWHLEIDEELGGEPIREIGFGAQGQAIAVAPWNGEDGFIVNSSANFDPDACKQITADQFEQEWSRFHATHPTEPQVAKATQVQAQL